MVLFYAKLLTIAVFVVKYRRICKDNAETKQGKAA